MEGYGLFAGERDAPDAPALPRAAPDKLTTDLTLSQPNVVALRHGQAPRQWSAREGTNAASMTGIAFKRKATGLALMFRIEHNRRRGTGSV